MTMEAKKMMTCLLLLGCVAMCSSGKCFRFGNFSSFTEEMIEQRCLTMPGFAAVADGYAGAPEGKNRELAAQCYVFKQGLFDGNVPDVEKVEAAFRRYGTSPSKEAAMDKALASCDSSLLLSYQAYEYLQCVENACEAP